MASIISFTFREAVVDVVYKGNNLIWNNFIILKCLTVKLVIIIFYMHDYFLKCSFMQLLRIFNTKRLESIASVQKHPPQSRLLPCSSQF